MNPLIKNYKGIFLPAHEKHLDAWMDKMGMRPDGVPNYQLSKIKTVLGAVTKRRVCVEIGAHCGLHAYHYAKQFEHLHAFEPIALHRECFALNVKGANVTLHDCALGNIEGSVAMHTEHTSSGDTYVNGTGDIPLKTLDSFNLENVDYIKLDCEGYELYALQGGEQTIRRSWPVIMVEQKPGKAQKFGLNETEAVTLLKSLGYTCAKEMSGDFIMLPPAELAN